MANQLKTLDLTLPIGNLEAYIHWTNQIPLLTAEEEQELAVRFQQQQDRDAARGLIMPHLRYVVKVAKGYAGYGLSEADLIQEGNIGLMKAVKRFNPEMGVRLVTFAMHWIKAEIHEFILRNWRIVKIATTKAQRKLFFNLRQAKKHLGWFSREEAQEVAEDLKVSADTVLQMEARMHAYDAALENTDDDENSTAPIHYLEDVNSNPAQILEADNFEEDNKERLHQALDNLDERSKVILQRRWLLEKKSTLQELAEEFNVSAERIRQLEKQAMQQLKEAL